MEIGTIDVSPGEFDTGWLEVTGLPTGGAERLPLVVARGELEGPTLWLTGGVHGDEATGIVVAQDVVHEQLTETLCGTLVCVPVVNPAGLRRNARTSYYGDHDPNRYFPDPESDSERPPNTQERIDRRLFEEITDTADWVIDLHTARIDSLPFVIRDRVLYGDRRNSDDAEELSERVGTLAAAFPFPTIREYPAAEYLEENLQRSAAGAALNGAGIPAITVELGGHSVVDEGIRAAAVEGVYRAMANFDMFDDGPPSPPNRTSVGKREISPPVEYDVRRALHPRTETAGLVRHRVKPGDVLSAGDPVADVVTPTGERIDVVEADQDGFVISRNEGLAVFEGDPVASMAVRDDGALVAERS
ncbi:succinylglutamate desuccinylase/aspartoacylase family protein [Halalkaliarchaeum sp. AArc-GB]|uniref:succinylglutamate desuccinylase/aspartoacylase family protein n=1 Tax=Halalkaliarchaeum sp. AArc-GB TaxID=3074078 RepID=UPI00285C746B|nr:succinylglutamate desuccinylase/aspartoacylase family protein [Halalkaliarchaeum sp. AArc-GB]MDR5674182.1 succinylglutamate desuccinylase/aspartoacylase family protein [Halalkaliarchaeum sp. AArc-GB]